MKGNLQIVQIHLNYRNVQVDSNTVLNLQTLYLCSRGLEKGENF